ncbi:MAG: methyltransferase domain-containing protein [Chlorobi bacterium]|nr:methyltransferase domain-containing protein [Chlorobiota bacterium]
MSETRKYWDERYRSGMTGWDTGAETPAFRSWLERHPEIHGRAFVPGCGYGHDALMLARLGFEVTAVDVSDIALSRLRRAADAEHLCVETLNEDFFHLPEPLSGAFDLALEYTSYCAIDPARRREYVEVLVSVLKPGGVLVALLFPIGWKEGGPPHAVDVREFHSLLPSGGEILEDYWPEDSIPPRKGREKMLAWRKTAGLSNG